MGFVLATFNVLDLFDASDPERIDRLAALVAPHAPDVVALQEVGNEDSTNAFARALSLEGSRGSTWEIVRGDADDRGIRCALLSRHRVVSRDVLCAEHLPFPRFHREDPEPFFSHGVSRIPLRRSIPDVVVAVAGFGPVRVMVVHFKSRRGKFMIDDREPSLLTTAELAASEARAIVWRSAEALFVRRAVDDRLAKNPNEMLCVCGDFNDVPQSLPLRIVTGEAGSDPKTPRSDRLTSCAESIPLADRYSVDHDGDPAAIDHALMSPALAARFSRAFYERATAPPPSDHAPLIVRFL